MKFVLRPWLLAEDKHSRKPNEVSCVLEVRNKTSSFWLTGDVEKQGEAEIVERLTQDALNDLKDSIFFACPLVLL